MKKIIKFIKKQLEEDLTIYQGDPEKIAKTKQRLTRVARAIEVLEQAAANADAQGNTELAETARQKAKQLRDWANIDLEDEEEEEEEETREDEDENEEDEMSKEEEQEDDDTTLKSEADIPEESEEETDGDGDSSDSDDGDDGNGAKQETDDEADNSDNINGKNDNEDDDDNDEKDPFKNPFSFDIESGDKTIPLDDTLSPEEAIKNIKKALGSDYMLGDKQPGIKKGLEDILAGGLKLESLTEDIDLTTKNNHITIISDDDFEEVLNNALDIINKIQKVDLSSDIQTRVKAIQKDNDDPILNQELMDDDNVNRAEERAAQRAAKQELAKYRTRNAGSSTEDFKQMLRLAIKSQVDKITQEEDTWSTINRRHQDDDVIAPGTWETEINQKNIVTIQVYLDCSSSFNASDIERERSFLSVIDKFVQEGKVKIELIYFADDLHSTFSAARAEGGTGAWRYIVKKLQDTKPQNVIIITDSDMNSACKARAQTYTARGCVWYIWKRYDAPELPKHVRGLKGTYEYWLN